MESDKKEKESQKEEKPKEETPKGETPKEETPNEETPAAPEMSTVGMPSKEFNLKDSNNNEYNLKIFQGKNSIIFNARLLGDLSEVLYSEETDFEEFHNLNRFFKQYSSIDELFTILFQTLEDNELIISKAEKRIG